MKLEDFIQKLPEFATIRAGIAPSSRQLLTGLSGSAKTLSIVSLMHETKRPLVYVTDTQYHAGQAVTDFSNRLEDNELYEFPAEELLAAEVATSSPEFRANRISALAVLRAEQPAVIVTSIAGLRRYLPSLTTFDQARIPLKVGGDVELSQMQIELNAMGYTHQKLVSVPGEFAVRGSIIDIYPLTEDNPVRIDLFDTEIDSIRSFDATTQRSIENVDSVTILPATDFLLNDQDREAAADRLTKTLKKNVAKLGDDAAETLTNRVAPMIDNLKKGAVDPELVEFSDLIFDEKTTLVDYLAENGLVVFDDYSRLVDAERQLLDDEENWATDKVAHHQIFEKQQFGIPFRDTVKKHARPQLLLSLFRKGIGNIKLTDMVDIQARAVPQFFGQMPQLKVEMDRWQRQKQTIVVLVQGEERLTKVEQTLTDFGINAVMTKADEIQENRVQIIPDRLANGFEIQEAGLVVIAESEMFNKVATKRPRRQTMENAERLKSYTDLKPGDYVVHVNHGIGQFIGMQTMEVDGVHQDYMTIDYRDNAQLFIPVTQLNLIQKYVSAEDKTPHVNKLGGSEWKKTKAKVAGKIEDIADELVELYAKRETEPGFAFPKDDSLQTDFDNAFPYPETADQMRSIDEIKHDMQRARPMDRLLVGDVGYGKTEVALRAAFKAIEAGKQVAFLVPTTILAQQHFQTMVDRFEGFPVKIAMMSRFQTHAEMKQTVAELASGEVDIVVGTHRLLSKDVVFKDLGLLLVDEEQRFGVKHKERLKQLRQDVDVLTLTATPIPRTLHMSMLGVRDLSVIETPPANRFPIQTYVMEQNAGAVTDGIRRELERGGQVFYLHNRVGDIERTVTELQVLLPEASIGYIHGQMTETQIENALYAFMNREYDVLVTTTIIETGMDIPNANTLFVENADRMGLSQLYQLRGRVGRSNRVAYAYFMYQPNKVLTEVSEKRLEAIKDFTELGSGFKIAMRDLSIRGAGSLLGRQQHGFIDSVGYDLYTEMLSEAVARKRGQKKIEKTDTTIELNVEAYLPDDYIDDQQQKIELYKRIRQMESDTDATEIDEDLIDRFGEYPEAVAHLLEIGRIKLRADHALIEKIRQEKDNLFVTLSKKSTERLGGEDVFKALGETKLKATVGLNNDRMQIKLVIQPRMGEDEWLKELASFVEALDQVMLVAQPETKP